MEARPGLEPGCGTLHRPRVIFRHRAVVIMSSATTQRQGYGEQVVNGRPRALDRLGQSRLATTARAIRGGYACQLFRRNFTPRLISLIYAAL